MNAQMTAATFKPSGAMPVLLLLDNSRTLYQSENVPKGAVACCFVHFIRNDTETALNNSKVARNIKEKQEGGKRTIHVQVGIYLLVSNATGACIEKAGAELVSVKGPAAMNSDHYSEVIY